MGRFIKMNHKLLISLCLFHSFHFILSDFTISEATSTIGPDSQDSQLNETQFDLDVEETLIALRKAHGLGPTHQRLAWQTANGLAYNQRGVFRLKGIFSLPKSFFACRFPLAVESVEFDQQNYAICISSKTQTDPAQVTAGPVGSDGWQPKFNWKVEDPRGVIGFVSHSTDTRDRNLYVLTADAARSDGTDVIVINSGFEPIHKERHTVHSRYPTAIAVWFSNTDNVHHLAIANSNGPGAQSFQSETFTYNWIGTYFDLYASITTYYVRDICHFDINSNEYLAIANHKASTNNHQIDSEIFKFDIDRKKWFSLQRIQTYGASDWEFFTFGDGHHQEQFLAVANTYDVIHDRREFQVNSVIYKFSDGKFVPFQCLPTVGANQIKALKGSRGEFVLTVSNEFEGVHLYQYNGWRFVKSPISFTSDSMGPGARSMHFLPKFPILLVSNNHQPFGYGAFRFDFQHEDEFGKWHNKSLAFCMQTTRDVQQLGVHQLETHFRDVVYVDQPQPVVLESDLVYNSGLDIGGQVSTPKLVDESKNEELSQDIIKKLVDLDLNLAGIEKRLREIDNLLANALRVDQLHQVVTAPFTFNSVEFDCALDDNCFVGELNTDIINNDDVRNLQQEIIPINKNVKISHPLHFEELLFARDVQVNGFVNGLNTSHIVTKSGNHDIIGPKTFTGHVSVNEITVNHLINNRIIHPATVMLTDQDQVVNGDVTFAEDIRVSNLNVNQISNMSLNRIYAELVTRDGDYIITGSNSFSELNTIDVGFATNATLNGVDLVKTWENVLWTHLDQDIIAPINFTNLNIERNLIVNGLINGIRIPENVLMRNQPAEITAPKQFILTCSIDRVDVTHSLNGLGLIPGTDQLDIMLKTRPQIVFAPKTFNYIHLGGHSQVFGTVDGVKLSQLARSAFLRNQSLNLPGNWEIFGNVIFDQDLMIFGLVNDLDLNLLYNNTLKLSDSEIPAFVNLDLDSASFANLEAPLVNGLNLVNDLMTKRTPQIIYGHKTFDHLIIENHIRLETLNGIQFSFFNDALLRHGNQNVTGTKVFTSDLLVNQLVVKRVNGIDMFNDLIKINGPGEEIIFGPKTFQDIKVLGNTSVDGHLQVSGKINDVFAGDLFGNTLLYDTPQTVTGHLKVEQIEVPRGTNLEVGLINNINLHTLMSDAVLVDIDQVISGTKTFTAPVHSDNVLFTGNINGVTDWDIRQNWLLRDADQTIFANLTVDDLMVGGHVLMKTPVVNGINLIKMNSDIVKVNEPATIQGPNFFDGSVLSNGNINLNGKIQGLDLDKEAVTKNGNHQLDGHITFAQGIQVEENLLVHGRIDDVDINDICQNSVRNNNLNQQINSTITVYGNVIFRSPLSIYGMIKNDSASLNGINLIALNRSLLKINEPTIVRGTKKFKQLILNGPVSIRGSVGGVERILHRYLSLTKNQEITSKIVFHKNIDFMNKLDVQGHLTSKDQFISGVNLQHLGDSVLKLHDDQTISGHFTFEDDVYFERDLTIASNRINEFHLFNDLMNKKRDNVVTVAKIFARDTTVLGNLDQAEQKTVQNVDISEMARDSVYKTNGNYLISGVKSFKNLEVDHLNVKSANGIEISGKNLLLTFGKQNILAPKRINNMVKVNGNVNAKTLNLIDLPSTVQRLVLKGYNNTIAAKKSFYEPLTVHTATSFGKIDGVDVNQLNSFVRLPVDIMDIKNEKDQLQDNLMKMHLVLSYHSVDVAYYQLKANLQAGSVLFQLFNHLLNQWMIIFLDGIRQPIPCQNVLLYSYDQNPDSFKHFANIYAPEPTSAVAFSFNNQEFLLIANLINDNSQCISKNPSANRMKVFGSGDALTQILTYDRNKHVYEQIGLIRSQPVVDLKLIKLPTPCVLLVVVNGPSQLYCLDQFGIFVLRENVNFAGAEELSLLSSNLFNQTLVAAANTIRTFDSVVSDVLIFKLSNGRFGSAIQRIPVIHPTAVHLAEHLLENVVFLFVAERKLANYHPTVRVLRYHPGATFAFEDVQQIRDEQVNAIGSVHLDDGDLMVFMLLEEHLKIYRLKGVSGFAKVDGLFTRGAVGFFAFNHLSQSGQFKFFDNQFLDGHWVSLWRQVNCNSKHMPTRCRYENDLLKAKIVGN